MSRITSYLSIAIMIQLVPAVGFADQAAWERAFEPNALASYHGGDVTGILVASAGDPGRALTEATAGLRASYSRARLFDLVMDDQALGAVTGMSDAEIVKKAKHLPVSHVAIVRIYGGKGGEVAQAVVTVYDKWGSVYASFVVKENQLLGFKQSAASSAPPPYTAPEPQPSKAAPLGDPFGPSADSPDPGKAAALPPALGSIPVTPSEKKFAKEYLWFTGPQYNKKGQLKSWDRNSVAYLGSKKKKIDGKDFYLAAGRKDLASKYSGKNITRWSLILGGIAVTFGGIAYPITRNEDCTGLPAPDQPDCESGNNRRATIGGVAAGVGLLSWFVGWYAINPHPVSAKEAQKIVDTHNANLRRKYGLPAGYTVRPEPKPSKKDKKKKKSSFLQIQPLVGPTGGGISLSGRF